MISKKNVKWLVVAILILLSFIVFRHSTTYYEVTVNDKIIGSVKTKEVFESAKSEILEELSGIHEEAKAECQNEFLLTKKHEFHHPITPTLILKKNIAFEGDVVSPAKGLFVDNKEVLTAIKERTLQSVLAKVDDYFATEKEPIPDYAQSIEIRDVKVPIASGYSELSVEQMVNHIISGGTKKRVYIIEKGDTISGIADEFGLTVNDIKKANLDIDINRIKIGQEISLNLLTPLFYPKELIPLYGTTSN